MDIQDRELLCRRLLKAKDDRQWDLTWNTLTQEQRTTLIDDGLVEETYENEYDLTIDGIRTAIDHQKVIDYFRNMLETDYSIDTRKYAWSVFIPDFLTWFKCEVIGTHKTTGYTITLTDCWIDADGTVNQCGSGGLRI